MLCGACQRRRAEKGRYFLIFVFLPPFSGGFRGANRLIYQAKKRGIDRWSRFFSQNHFFCAKVPGWLEKCWLSAQSSGLEGTGVPPRRGAGQRNYRGRTGCDRGGSGSRKDARERYSHESMTGDSAGRMRVSPGKSRKLERDLASDAKESADSGSDAGEGLTPGPVRKVRQRQKELRGIGSDARGAFSSELAIAAFPRGPSRGPGLRRPYRVTCRAARPHPRDRCAACR